MDSLYLEVSGLSYTTFFARCKPAVIVNMKKSFFYLFSVFILIQVSWRKFDQPNKWIISSSSFLRAIWSVITNGHSSHFFNFTESLLYMTYQHKPTEASLLASSWGALSHWHAECILQPSRTWPHILWRGTWTVLERRNVHPLQWGVSTWTLGSSEQCH